MVFSHLALLDFLQYSGDSIVHYLLNNSPCSFVHHFQLLLLRVSTEPYIVLHNGDSILFFLLPLPLVFLLWGIQNNYVGQRVYGQLQWLIRNLVLLVGQILQKHYNLEHSANDNPYIFVYNNHQKNPKKGVSQHAVHQNCFLCQKDSTEYDPNFFRLFW